MMSERVLIAAPLETVETGQEFAWLPLHMPVLGWLAINNSIDRGTLGAASYRAFHDQLVYQRARAVDRTLVGPKRDRAVTILDNVEMTPWAMVYDAAAERGLLPSDGSVLARFLPQIPDLSADVPVVEGQTRAVGRDQDIPFRQVAIFSQTSEQPEVFKVAITYQLGVK